MTLKELEAGKTAIVTAVGGEGALRQHFLDMGVIPGAEVTVVKLAPMGDPIELQIHGYELTLRLADAAQIQVEPAPAKTKAAWGRRENSTQRGAATLCPRGPFLPLPWWGTRIAARPPSSISSPGRNSTWGTSPG